MDYVIYNQDGEILKTITCGPKQIKAQVQEGESYIEGTCNDATQHIVDGVVTNKPPVPEVPMDYTEKRRLSYPPIGDQLDAIWKGGVDMADMKARIVAVKAKYPKK